MAIKAKTLVLILACSFAFVACGGSTPPPKKAKKKKVVKPKPKPKPLPKTHEVRLFRPVKVGFEYDIAVSGKRVTKMMSRGKVVKARSGTWEWSYSATVTVKAVSERGKPTMEEHEVSSFILTKNGKQTRIKDDPIVIATVKKGKKSFKINGKRAKREIADVLNAIVNLDKGSPPADELYGSSVQRKVGDTWPVNKAGVLAAFGKQFNSKTMPVKEENISGVVSLAGAEKRDGVDRLHLLVGVQIAKVAPPLGRMKPTAGEMTFSVDTWIAQDTGLADFGNETKKLKMHVEAKGFMLDYAQEQTAKYTYPKKDK